MSRFSVFVKSRMVMAVMKTAATQLAMMAPIWVFVKVIASAEGAIVLLEEYLLCVAVGVSDREKQCFREY